MIRNQYDNTYQDQYTSGNKIVLLAMTRFSFSLSYSVFSFLIVECDMPPHVSYYLVISTDNIAIVICYILNKTEVLV